MYIHIYHKRYTHISVWLARIFDPLSSEIVQFSFKYSVSS